MATKIITVNNPAPAPSSGADVNKGAPLSSAELDQNFVNLRKTIDDLAYSTDSIRIANSKIPASATAAGVAGQICWSSTHIYVCVATNTWKRVAISTW